MPPHEVETLESLKAAQAAYLAAAIEAHRVFSTTREGEVGDRALRWATYDANYAAHDALVETCVRVLGSVPNYGRRARVYKLLNDLREIEHDQFDACFEEINELVEACATPTGDT